MFSHADSCDDAVDGKHDAQQTVRFAPSLLQIRALRPGGRKGLVLDRDQPDSAAGPASGLFVRIFAARSAANVIHLLPTNVLHAGHRFAIDRRLPVKFGYGALNERCRSTCSLVAGIKDV